MFFWIWTVLPVFSLQILSLEACLLNSTISLAMMVRIFLDISGQLLRKMIGDKSVCRLHHWEIQSPVLLVFSLRAYTKVLEQASILFDCSCKEVLRHSSSLLLFVSLIWCCLAHASILLTNIYQRCWAALCNRNLYIFNCGFRCQPSGKARQCPSQACMWCWQKVQSLIACKPWTWTVKSTHFMNHILISCFPAHDWIQQTQCISE